MLGQSLSDEDATEAEAELAVLEAELEPELPSVPTTQASAGCCCRTPAACCLRRVLGIQAQAEPNWALTTLRCPDPLARSWRWRQNQRRWRRRSRRRRKRRRRKSNKRRGAGNWSGRWPPEQAAQWAWLRKLGVLRPSSLE